jgi:hypothetical protein
MNGIEQLVHIHRATPIARSNPLAQPRPCGRGITLAPRAPCCYDLLVLADTDIGKQPRTMADSVPRKQRYDEYAT